MLTTTIAALLKPLPIALLLCMFLIIRTHQKFNFNFLLLLLSTVILTIFSSPITANLMLRSLENQYQSLALNEIPMADGLILLSGGMELPFPPRKNAELGSRGDRLRLTHAILQLHPDLTLVLAGGHNETHGSEPQHAFELLESWGIENTTTVFEENSGTTKETANELFKAIEKHDIKSALLVTSAYHMPRSVQLMSKLGIELIPMPANFLITKSDSKKGILNFIPSSLALSGSALALHEYTGMLFNHLAEYADSQTAQR